MERKENVFLIGAGDHAKVVLSTLEACNIGCAGIYDDNPKLWGKSLWCIPILGPVSDMPDTPETMAIIAIGSNEVRRRMAARFKNVCQERLLARARPPARDSKQLRAPRRRDDNLRGLHR